MRRLRLFFLGAVGMVITSSAMAAPSTTQTAIFAGGCFWCMEPPFDAAEGVVKTTVGYTGGQVANPTYEQVVSKTTGHYEAIEVVYDPAKISYEQLLGIFWENIDPVDAGGQFADRGQTYHTAIFYRDEAQKKAAEHSKSEVANADAAVRYRRRDPASRGGKRSTLSARAGRVAPLPPDAACWR